MEINFTPRINRELAELGLHTVLCGKRTLNEFEIELPCGLPYRLGDRIKMGAFSYILSERWQDNVIIGRYCSIAENVKLNLDRHPSDWLSTSPFQYNKKQNFLETRNTLEFMTSRPTIIGNDVWIGDSVLIKEGITIGDGAIVGCGALVTKDVPPYAIVVGAPAAVLRYRFPDPVIERLQELQWWDYDYRDFLGGAPSGEQALAAGPCAGVDFDRIESAIDQISRRIETGSARKYRGRVLTRDDFSPYAEIALRDKAKKYGARVKRRIARGVKGLLKGRGA